MATSGIPSALCTITSRYHPHPACDDSKGLARRLKVSEVSGRLRLTQAHLRACQPSTAVLSPFRSGRTLLPSFPPRTHPNGEDGAGAAARGARPVRCACASGSSAPASGSQPGRSSVARSRGRARSGGACAEGLGNWVPPLGPRACALWAPASRPEGEEQERWRRWWKM